MPKRYPDAMAVTWRYTQRGRRAHAVELLRGQLGQTEQQRVAPVALCGFRAGSPWNGWSLFVGEDADRCTACGPLYASWGQVRRPDHVRRARAAATKAHRTTKRVAAARAIPVEHRP